MVLRLIISEYDACYWGWNEKDKRDELKEKNPWFLVAKNSEGQTVAFSHFKFDFDEEIAVLYCYEVWNLNGFRFDFGTSAKYEWNNI